ncbi:hypothetical protein AB0L00_04995 [Actinoallomurus sp. NPDC052308]|uniref:hypothetical protein n=1 Tax=Actinoallomurus sp. NPDC052308 TaxID=3155530 RepID=UPI00342B9307
MTAATLVDGLTPPVGGDIIATTSILRRRFPSAVVWFGPFTRRWWAMVRAGDRWCLVDAPDPDELTGSIIRVLS